MNESINESTAKKIECNGMNFEHQKGAFAHAYIEKMSERECMRANE